MQFQNKVLTMGGFDLMHIGHLSFLNACKAIAGPQGRLYVGVNSDEFMESYKRQPVFTASERKRLVSSVVPGASIFDVTKHDAKDYIITYNPNIIVIGEDWAHKDYFTQIGVTKEWLKSQGIILLYKHIDEEITTTKIIERVKNL